MVSIVRILLSVCAATLVRGQTSVCYSSLDCHGNKLDVVLPEKSEASLFPSECCSSAARGLSYRQSEGEPCANCYTDDNFESYGDKFYLALFGNFQPQTSFSRIGKVRLSVSPVTEEESSFTVERQGKKTKYTAPCEVEYKSEDVNLDSIKTRDQSIVIRSENGDELSVVAFAEEYSSSDTFRVMPCVRLPDVGYEYYAVSVPKASLKLEFGDLDIIADVEGKSAIVIVTTEDNTDISITLTQDITNVDANDIMSQIGGGDTLSAGVEYTFKLSQSKQTLYLASEDDLTGSRIVSSKPIAFISGHECGTVPFNIFYCDQLVEQLPPSATWGKRFISAPIEGRSAVDVFRVVASRDNTILRSSCFQGNNITLNAGEFREFNMSSSSYCYYESNETLLMVQFSVASDLDNVLAGDPFMVVVPPVEQYRNSYNISTFVSSDKTNPGTNYINILIPANASESGTPQDILFDGQPLSSSVQFVKIPCVFSEEVCAYAAQMNTTAVSHVLSTSDPSVVVNAIVYWLSFRVGHGYFAGMTQDPIALPMISLNNSKYEEFENDTLNITIVRSGDFALPITVYLTSIQVTRDNAALVGEDFVARTEEVLVSEPSTVVSMEFIDDVFPEGDEQFEVFLSAAPGALVVSPAYATVTILNEDPPLPVMNVSFVATTIDVIEGAGVIKLVLKKTEGAIGPVSVRIYTEEGTAVEGEDFIGVNNTLTFGVDETEMEVLVFILDNSALEELEQFTVKIKAIEGIFPVAVTNSTATVLVDDNDVVVLGFSQVDFTTSENVEGVGVRVEVMVGQLERSVAVWVNSTQQSTATPGQDFERVSRLLTFDSERNSGVVSFGIFNDVEREVAIETVNLQLSFVEEEANSKIRLLPNQMVVSIMDDDEVEVGMLPVRGTVREGEGSARVNISILQGTLGNLPISFIVSTANGTAQANTDYEQREEVVTLSDLNPFEELIFPVMDDSEYEGRSNEIFFVQAQLDPNGQNSERVKIASDLARTPITIIDNEVRPFASIGFIQRTWMVSEGAGEVVLLLESDGRNVEPVEVTYSFQNGSETAEVGLDYLNGGGGVGTLLFPPETTVAAITVSVIDDESAESTEFFTVSLFPGQDVALTADQATVYIEDNDAVEAQLSMTRYTISEAAASVEVVVQISTATETVQLNISTFDGTALAGVDYVQREVQLTFSPGDFERSVTIQVINDRIQEDTELFFVTLHSPVSNLKVELPQTNTSIFVIDDDTVGNPLEPSLSVESTSTTSVSLVWTQDPIQPVTRFFLSWTYTGPCDPQPPQSVIIGGEERSYTIIDLEEGANYTFGLTAINGIGTSPENMVTGYTPPAAPSGPPRNLQATEITESSVVIQWEEIDCLDQNGIIIRYEITLNGSLLSSTDPGQFTSSILNLSPETSYIITVTGVNGAGNGPASTITIRTAGRPVAIIGFLNTELNISEDGGFLNFNIGILTGTLGIDVVVNFNTEDRSAHAGQDYNQTISSLTFTDQLSLSVPVGIIDDTLFETPESFVGLLSADNLPSNVLLAPTEATGTILDNEQIIIGFDPANYNVNESDGTVTLIVSVLEGTLSEEQSIPVRVITGDDSAQAPSDYAQVSSVLTFTSSSTTQTVDVTIEDDSLLEIDEVFRATLGLVNSDDSSRVTLSPAEASVTIFDDDEAIIGFDPDAYNGSEGTDLFVDLNVKVISGQLGRDVIVLFNTMDGSAISGADFDGVSNQQLIFSPTVSTLPVRVNILNDNVLEQLTERFTAILSSEVPRLTLLPDDASVDIFDDDLVTFGFDQAQYSVLENASFVTVTIRQISGGALDRNVFITLETGDGTAISSGEQDFMAHSVELTFGPGNTQQDVMIAIIDDRRLEHDEQFNSVVSLTVADPAVDLSPANADITIIDNDKVIIGFNQTRYDVSENIGQAVVYVVVIDGILRRQVVVNFITADNTALAGSDYTAVGSTSLTFDMNNLQFAIPIDIINDEIHELDENFFGRLSTVDEDAILQPGQTMIHILNDDVVTFSFRQPVYMFMENIGTGTVCVDKMGATDQTITVTVNGATQSGAFTQTLAFSPNDNSSCIDFPVIDDIIALEDPEEFVWTLVPIPVPSVDLGTNSTRIIIIDDDTLVLNLEKSENIPEDSGTAQACVTFSNPFAREFEISPSVSRPPNNTVPAIATPAFDYSDVIAPILARPGDTQVCFDIVINDDDLVEESEECLMASFTAEDLENLMIGDSSSLCCIIDDDNVTIGFRPVQYTVNEDAGTVTLFVHVLDGELARAVEVDFITEDGTATSSSPIDYNAPGVPITLQFTPDDLVAEVTITIENDGIIENAETFAGVLSTLDGAVYLAPERASVEITDDDEAVVGFVPTTYEVLEDAGSVTLNINLLEGILEREVTVSFSTGPGSATSADPADYESTTEILIFSPSISTNQVTVQIIDDDIRENNETFFGLITNDGQPVITNPDLAIVTIVDDNDETVIGFEETEYNVTEGGQREVCAVLTEGTLEKVVEVTVTSSDDSARVGDDYTVVNQVLTFDAMTSRVCFFTSTVEDDPLEDDESYLLTLTSDEPGLTLVPPQATVTIIDDDGVRIGLTQTVYTVTEGSGVQVEICAMLFEGELERNAIVTLETVDVSAVSQGAELDYQTLSVMLTFTDSMTTICRNVTIVNNDFYEDPESFNVRLTTLDPDVTLDPDMGTVTILDDDNVVIGFVLTSYFILENGGQQEVCAEVKMGTLRAEVEVQFSTSDGDATAPDDYIATTETLTFHSGMVQDCAVIPINLDRIAEGTERFYGNLATSAERVSLEPDRAEVAINDEIILTIGFVNAPYFTREETGFVTVTVAILSEGVVLDDDFVVGFETMELTGLQNTAEAVLDYTPLVKNLTFSSTIKSISFNVTIVDDENVELDEVFAGSLSVVTIGPDVPAVQLNPGNARITILDEEDTVTIGVTETFIIVNESIGVRQVCAEVTDGELERTVLVTLGLNQVTATPGQDYMMESFELAFDATNKGPICNDVVIVSDDVYEGEEVLTFNLTTGDSAVILEPDSGVLVIQDDDEVVLGWEVELYSVNENVAQAEICAIVHQGTLAVQLPQLNIATRDGTATRGGPGVQQDYIPPPNPNNFVFSSTNMGQMCTNIPIVEDIFLELTIEDFFADLSFSAGEEPERVTILPVTTTVQITDNDVATIGFQDTTYRVDESAGTASLTVAVLTGTLDTEIVVNLNTADDSAVSPDDYLAQTVTLTFTPTMTQVTISVPIIDDNLDEEDEERFNASLTQVTVNPRVSIDPSEAEVLIADNDVVMIGFEETLYSTTENNTRTVVVCALIRDGSPQLAKTVEVELMSMDASAIAPGDYNQITTTLIFDEDNSRRCVEFTGVEDDVVDPNENFTVILTGGDDVILVPDTAVVVIVDQIPIIVGFVEGMYTFLENQGQGTIQVRKNQVSDIPFMVVVYGGPSTQTRIRQSAAPISNQTITFLAGPSAPNVINVNIAITDDIVTLEDTETYEVHLRIVGFAPNVEIGRHEITTVNVLDDDVVTIGFGSDGITVDESTGMFMMCVVKDREALQNITVTIAAQDVTAITDLDYSPGSIPTTVTIPASQSQACFTGPIIDDLIGLEPNESFTLTITAISPDRDVIRLGTAMTEITIIDDDIVRVRYEEPNYLFREEIGQATVCLIKDLETAVAISVDSETLPDTALDPEDYTGGTFGVNFGTGANDRQCIQITLVNDAVREEREDFFVDVVLDDTGRVRAGDPSRTIVAIEDTGIAVNDTVIGDPLMTVPILVTDNDLQALGVDRVSLCYEIHGRKDTNYNLVTDQCATVNAHYTDITTYLNVIDQIGVRAVDESGSCKNIQVDVDGCSASIDGTPITSLYSSQGISVRPYSRRVRITVPNCNELSLVMWVICETRTLEDPFGGDASVTGDMIKFVVARGLNFGHRKAHGILGQFWNVPVSVEPFDGLDRNGQPVPSRYVVNVTSTYSNNERSYTGILYELNWAFEKDPCLYVGNRQAGPIYEVKVPNDAVIEGRYSEYMVPDLFSEDDFVYGLFEEDSCQPDGIISN